MSWLGDLIKGGMESNGKDLTITEGYLTIKGRSETPDTTEVTVLMKDASGDILQATGITVPTDAETGYAKGCLFIDTDVAAGTTGLYVNVGTNTSCNFDAVSDA
jgi:hypothetical protein